MLSDESSGHRILVKKPNKEIREELRLEPDGERIGFAVRVCFGGVVWVTENQIILILFKPSLSGCFPIRDQFDVKENVQ